MQFLMHDFKLNHQSS